MINSVKARTPILALILFVFAVGYTFAANKVVVIPMGADAPPSAQWALVKGDGTIINQSGGISVLSSTGAGAYWIEFGRDLRGRAIMATQRWSSSVGSVGATICADGDDSDDETVNCGVPPYGKTSVMAVRTTDKTGGLADVSFYVVVHP